MPTILEEATKKRVLIQHWASNAIPLEEAQKRGLIRYSAMTCWRNWTCREALYDFAQQSRQASPVLVRMDPKRMALFTQHRPEKATRKRRRQKNPSP